MLPANYGRAAARPAALLFAAPIPRGSIPGETHTRRVQGV